MKKLEKLGRKLSKEEQRRITGGDAPNCPTGMDCACHACVSASGVVLTYGFGACSSSAPCASGTCKNYCCNVFESGAYC